MDEVLVVGEALVDIVHGPDTDTEFPGGSRRTLPWAVHDSDAA